MIASSVIKEEVNYLLKKNFYELLGFALGAEATENSSSETASAAIAAFEAADANAIATPITLGSLIRAARKEKGYTQEQLSKLLKMHTTYLSKVEHDSASSFLRESTLLSLAQCLDLDQREVFLLAGIIPKEDRCFVQNNYKAIAALLKKIQSVDL